jgi:hypothetical protein
VQIYQRLEVLGEELVSRVLIVRHQPRLGELAVADMAHEHRSVLKGPALALAVSDIDRDRMLVVGHDVVELGAEGAASELRDLGKEAQDLVLAAVVT